jgi:superfamily II DNA or RNA helicase
MISLYQHQQEAKERAADWYGLWLGAGSGKTRTAMAIAEGYILVIAPRQQIDDGIWEKEALLHKKTCTTVTHDKFRLHLDEYKYYDTVIVDEAHAMVGVNTNLRSKKGIPFIDISARFAALAGYLCRYKPKRLLLLTATPTKNPMTVWGILKILNRQFDFLSMVPVGFYKWRAQFYIEKPLTAWRKLYIPKYNKANAEFLTDQLKKYGATGRYQDFIDTPPEYHKVEHVPLSPAQKGAIEEIEEEFMQDIVRIGKLHMAENIGAVHKMDMLVKYCDEFDQVLIFARYIEQIKEIHAHLMKEYPGRKIMVLTGSTKHRDTFMADAQKSEPCIVIVQASVSAGWELPEYPITIFASMDWSIVSYTQGIGRISRAHRPKKNIYVYLLSTAKQKTMDQKVYKTVVENKTSFIEALYDKA